MPHAFRLTSMTLSQAVLLSDLWVAFAAVVAGSAGSTLAAKLLMFASLVAAGSMAAAICLVEEASRQSQSDTDSKRAVSGVHPTTGTRK